jgi:hypothetical protein
MNEDYDTEEQNNMFEEYLEATGCDRQKYRGSYGYDEAEWQAFQHGWNAAKKHFQVTK